MIRRSPALLRLLALLAAATARMDAAEPAGPAQGATGQDVKATAPGPVPTFNKDVAPIVFEKCSLCHRPGESAPFSLLTYDNVKRRAKLVREVTQSHYMPPWLPGLEPVEFAGARGLTEKQIAMIAQWVEGESAEGDARDLPALPVWKEGWQLGEPDLVVEMPDAYTLGAEGKDVFRNFVLPVPLDRDRFVRAIEFRPGNPKLIHHAVIMIDRSRSSRQRDAEDPEPGFEGMDVKGSVGSPDGHFLGWSPGKMPSTAPADMAWRLQQGADLVLMLHMLPTGKKEEVRAKVGIFFSETPPTREAVILRLGTEAMDIPAGETNYVVEDEARLPVDVDALGVYPHAHYLGKEFKAYAVLPDGTTRWLIHIKAWDFNWQDEYRFAQPLRLPKGSLIKMQYSYDNSAGNPRNPHTPPQRVLYGSRSEQEMSTLWIQMVPRNTADLPPLKQLVAQKRFAMEVAGFKFALQVDPNDAKAHNNLGVAMDMMRQPKVAQQHLEDAVRLNPQYAPAHYNLGVLQLAKGEKLKAMGNFQHTLEIDPHHVGARINLGSLMENQGALAEAEDHFTKALEIEDHPLAHYNLGVVLLKRANFTAARPHLEAALAAHPADPGILQNLGIACMKLKDFAAATRHFQSLIPLQPGNGDAHNLLGSVQLQQGNARAAIASFQRAISLNPLNKHAIDNLKRAEQSLNPPP